MDVRHPDTAYAVWTDNLAEGTPLAWYQGPAPWVLHRCRPWTTFIGEDARVDRCRCGSYRWGNGPWMFRNCRRWMGQQPLGPARSPMRVFELPNGGWIDLSDLLEEPLARPGYHATGPLTHLFGQAAR